MAFALKGNKNRGYKMYYPFICPKCGHNEIIEMKISTYTASEHYCPVCGEEMTREVKSLVCGMSIDKTSSFYRKCN